MITLFQIRDGIEELYSEYDTYIIALWKFIIALSSFLFINSKMGYFSKIDNIFFVLILALICSFLPVNSMILFSTVLILLQLYGLSLPALAVGGGIVIILLLLYFGIVPKNGYVVILTMLGFSMGIPCLIPIVYGLIAGPVVLIPICLATGAYYVLEAITGNVVQTEFAGGTVAEESQALLGQVKQILEQLMQEERLVLGIISMIAVFLVVYLIRTMAMENAWNFAIVMGVFTFGILYIGGSIVLNRMDDIIWVIGGTLASAAIAFVIKFMIYQVDYAKSMYVDFEDEDYVYYVRAVPKLKKGREDIGKY